MLTAPAVRVFKKRRAVKVCKRIGVLRKVRRHPVHDNTDSVLVQRVNQRHQLDRLAVAAVGRIIARHLIPPGAVKRVLGQGHHLDMGIAHLFQIRHQLIDHLGIGIIAAVLLTPPGAVVHLINRDRFIIGRRHAPLFHPGLILPGIGKIRRHRRIGRPHLGIKGVRIRLEHGFAAVGINAEFIVLSLAYTGDKNLPDAGVDVAAHSSEVCVPSVLVANHRNRLGIRRPDRKQIPLRAVRQHFFVRAQHPIAFIINALIKKVHGRLVDISHCFGIFSLTIFHL